MLSSRWARPLQAQELASADPTYYKHFRVTVLSQQTATSPRYDSSDKPSMSLIIRRRQSKESPRPLLHPLYLETDHIRQQSGSDIKDGPLPLLPIVIIEPYVVSKNR